MLSFFRKPVLRRSTRALCIGDRIEHKFFGTLLVLDEPIIIERALYDREVIVYHEFHCLAERTGTILWLKINRIRWID